MKNIILSIAIGLFYIAASAQGIDYKAIDVEVYQLDNGLTVILNEDHNTPQVFGGIVVRAGGKDDPKDATGMAHYMEHMLFKGTEELGTTNWEAEKPHIEAIFRLYDELGKTSDNTERAIIQKQINEESVKANEYAIPNEMWNLVRSIGGANMNAGTGPDHTIFYNSFPPTQIEKWLDLYSHRFEKPVFRSFQAELEVVYEEKNMHSDMFQFALLDNFRKQFFKNHPYGQQTLIGTVEDLKNPSLSKMYDFFTTWYVPNNMALIIVGDFDKNKVKQLVEDKFGKWQRKELPERISYEEKPFNGREFAEMKLTPVKIAILGFRTIPAGHPDETAFKICEAILSNNSKTGLLDKLMLDNKLIAAQSTSIPYNDQGVSLIFIIPKVIGQKLGAAEKLVLGELVKLKSGDFDSTFVENIKMELFREYQLKLESNSFKTNMLATAFSRNQSIDDMLQYPEQLMSITKDDVIKVARQYYGDNYLSFYSKMGFPKKKKIEKPGYKPVIVNTNAISEYAKKFQGVPEIKLNPSFVNFNKDVEHIAVSDNMDVYCVKNPANNIFTLKLKFKIGNKSNPDLIYAADVMNYAYPEGMSLDSFKAEFADIGSTYNISCNESYTIVEITGFDNSFNEAIILVSKLLKNPVLDQPKVDILHEGEKTNRKFERSEPDEVAEALYAWVRYDKKSDYIDRLSLAETKKLQADRLINAFKTIADYGVEIHYAGNINSVTISELCKTTFNYIGNEKVEFPVVLDIKPCNENTIFFVNKKKATQSKVFFLVNGSAYNPEVQADMDAFNLYFGGDFSGLVLQEIREFRSLAYTAAAKFTTPALKSKEAYFAGYVGTQADKTLEAVEVFDTLIRYMPAKPERVTMIKQYLLQSSISNRPHFRSLSEQIVKWENQGYTVDPAQYKRDAYENMSFENIQAFYSKNLAAKPVAICIVGDKSKIDMKKLSTYGKLIFVKESSLYSK